MVHNLGIVPHLQPEVMLENYENVLGSLPLITEDNCRSQVQTEVINEHTGKKRKTSSYSKNNNSTDTPMNIPSRGQRRTRTTLDVNEFISSTNEMNVLVRPRIRPRRSATRRPR